MVKSFRLIYAKVFEGFRQIENKLTTISIKLYSVVDNLSNLIYTNKIQTNLDTFQYILTFQVLIYNLIYVLYMYIIYITIKL